MSLALNADNNTLQQKPLQVRTPSGELQKEYTKGTRDLADRETNT